MRKLVIAIETVLLLTGCAAAVNLSAAAHQQAASQGTPAKAAKAPSADVLDKLLAPIALYPDQLLAQMLLCASNPGKVAALSEWLASHPDEKGTALQDAATKAGFDQSFVALVLFPDVVNDMAAKLEWTTQLGKAFAADRTAVFGSIQRLRGKAQQAGSLKDTPQQDVATKTTSSGQQVIVIEPANPQVVYVPQYNPQVVYTQPSTVVVQQSSSTDAAVAGALIGFTAGIAIGAAIDNDYYYGPYGWGRGAYMYDDAWDDWYDEREDMREDWQDHREDIVDERGDRARERAGTTERAHRDAPGEPAGDTGAARAAPYRRAGFGRDGRLDPHGAVRRSGELRPFDRRITRLQRHRANGRRAERHAFGRVLRLFERQIGAKGESAREEQPEQLAEFRQPPPLSVERSASVRILRRSATWRFTRVAPRFYRELVVGSREVNPARGAGWPHRRPGLSPGGNRIVAKLRHARGRRQGADCGDGIGKGRRHPSDLRTRGEGADRRLRSVECAAWPRSVQRGGGGTMVPDGHGERREDACRGQ